MKNMIELNKQETSYVAGGDMLSNIFIGGAFLLGIGIACTPCIIGASLYIYTEISHSRMMRRNQARGSNKKQ